MVETMTALAAKRQLRDRALDSTWPDDRRGGVAVLRAVLKLIDAGWTRHKMKVGVKNPRYCMAGAMEEVAPRYLSSHRRTARLALEAECGWLPDFNDAQKSKKPVLQAVRQAIADLEEG